MRLPSRSEASPRGRDRILVSFAGRSLSEDEAASIAARATGATLYRHLNIDHAAQVRELTGGLQAAARRLGLPPLLIAADHETGQLHAMGDDATPFAGAMALGATGDEDLAERVAAAIGTEIRAMGVNLVYAPDCDLATNPRNAVVGIRAFGDDPAAAARLVAASVRGLQSAGVAATVKHLPGHGDPSGDSHLGLPVVETPVEALRERELVPFRAGIDAGAALAMAGHLAVPAFTGRRDLPATLAPSILRDLLRDELAYRGVSVTDALDMGGITGGSDGSVDVGAALDAGTDLLLCGPDLAARDRVEAGLRAVVASGRLNTDDAQLARSRIDALRVWVDGFDDPELSVVGCAAHRDLARELARRSITLVRDRDGLLPVEPATRRRLLVIEPRPRDLTPADTTSWLPPGGLASALRFRWPELDGRIVDAGVSDAEIAALRSAAGSVDLVVLGTVDALGDASMVELARTLRAAGTPMVAVALRGPWDADAYPEIGTVVATYGIQPPSLAALSDALVGGAPITGRCPVRLRSA
jgi:beta-N-acetylhexosaminidase